MEGADPNKLSALLFEHDVLTHHINDVGTLLDGLNGSGMQTGTHHHPIVEDPGACDEKSAEGNRSSLRVARLLEWLRTC